MALRKKVEVILGATDKTGSGFKSMDKNIKGVTSSQKAMAAVGVAAAAAIGVAVVKAGKAYAQMVQEMARAGDNLDKMSQRTGIAVETLSELDFMAQRGGTSLDAVEKAVSKLAVSMYDAGRGSKEYVDAFSDLGIVTTDANGKMRAADDVFIDMADALNGVTSSTERLALARKILGRSGGEMLPMLKQGSKAIREQRDEVRALGGVMSTEFATASAEYQDKLTNMTTAWDGLKRTMTGPVLDDAADGFNRMAIAVSMLTGNMNDLDESATLDKITQLGVMFASWMPGIGGAVTGVQQLNDVLDHFEARAARLATQENAFVFGSEQAAAPLLPGLNGGDTASDESTAPRPFEGWSSGALKQDLKEVEGAIDGQRKLQEELALTNQAFYGLTTHIDFSTDSLSEWEGVSDMLDAESLDSDLSDMKDSMVEFGDDGQHAAEQIGLSFATAFGEMASGSADMDRIFKQLLTTVLSLAFGPAGGIIGNVLGGFFKDGGVVPEFAFGGSIPRAAAGMMVPDGPRGLDSRLIAAMPGEMVIDRSTVMGLQRFLANAETVMVPGTSSGGSSTVNQFIQRPVNKSEVLRLGDDTRLAIKESERGWL